MIRAMTSSTDSESRRALRRGPGRFLAAASLVVTAAVGPLAAPALAQTSPSDVAWERGDYAVAERLYAERLAADSTDRRALHRMALLLAWGERYDHSVDLFDKLLALDEGNVEAAVDRARVLAWRSDLRGALEAIEEVLAREPGHLPALQARARFEAWAGDHRAALESYDRILELAPGDLAARRQRAQVLSWTSRVEEAADAYADVLRADPADDEARLGLARTLAWSNRLDSAEVVYRSILERDPRHVEALQGFARTAAWRGDLRRGEERWRVALAASPDDAGSLVGLSQTLRWQGRHAEAVTYADRAVRLDPTGDARTELAWARLALAPNVSPTYTYERDSDGNRIGTMSLAASMRPTPTLELRADAYWRELTQTGPDGFERQTGGGQLAATWRPAGGWALTAAAGASRADQAGAETIPRWSASVHMPVHLPVRLSVGYGRRALDGTARLAENGVAIEELTVDAAIALAPRWSLDTRLVGADFVGEERNRRYFLRSDLAHRLGRDWRVGLGGTVFTFRDTFDEGYFNPDFFGLGEVQLRWLRELGPWVLGVEGAPGLQQVGSEGPVKGTLRFGGRLAYSVAPGRQLGIALGHSSHGVESLAPRDFDYRYRFLTLSGGWAF